MKASVSMALCLVLLVASLIPVIAQDKEVKLAGKLTCAKCELKLEAKCATVLVAKDGGKDVVYYVDDKSGKTKHEEYCQAAKEATVTGMISEKDGKKHIAVSKVELKK